MEYTREIAEQALECCGDKNNCEGCPLKGECESNPFESVIAKYVVELVKELKAEMSELDEYIVETRTSTSKTIENLTVEREIFREAAINYKNYLDNFGNYLNAGYEPSAAKYAAEMDMWRVIALERQAKEEELERLYAENIKLRSMINVSDS